MNKTPIEQLEDFERKEEKALLIMKIATDIINRYASAKIIVLDQACTCNFCKQKIPAKIPFILLESFDSKRDDKLFFCTDICAENAQIAEMKLFNCHMLKDFLPINKR